MKTELTKVELGNLTALFLQMKQTEEKLRGLLNGISTLIDDDPFFENLEYLDFDNMEEFITHYGIKIV